MSDVKEILGKYTQDIEDTIQKALTAAPPFMRGMISYHFGWVDQTFQPANFDRGKFLRPTLSLLVFDSLTGSYREALPVAACLEMIHNFSLIHDDIEDGDVERRGRSTVWAIWGRPLAINAGDFLYTLAFKTLYQLDPTKFAPESIFAVQKIINDACLYLTMGQDLDLRFEQIQDVSVEMYLDMVYKKTGALLEAAIMSGAMLGTADETILNNYRAFARNIGIAFQVRDDILGIWGDMAETGKSVDNDLRRKKKTLPILYMLNQSTGAEQQQLQKLYAGPEPLTAAQIGFVRDCLAMVEAQNYAQQKADNYIEKAFTALSKIDISNQPQAELEAIARFLVSRSR